MSEMARKDFTVKEEIVENLDIKSSISAETYLPPQNFWSVEQSNKQIDSSSQHPNIQQPTSQHSTTFPTSSYSTFQQPVIISNIQLQNRNVNLLETPSTSSYRIENCYTEPQDRKYFDTIANLETTHRRQLFQTPVVGPESTAEMTESKTPLQVLEQELQEERKKVKRLEEELKTTRELNLRLQDTLLKHFEGGNSMHVAQPPVNIADCSSQPQLFDLKDNMIHIGRNVYIEKKLWDRALLDGTVPLFVKSLATAIWGSRELMKRSVKGQKSNRMKTEAKRRLTPVKLLAIRDRALEKINEETNAKITKDEALTQIRKWVNDKIQALCRSGNMKNC